MYNQFILEELKTLNDLLNTGAITQGEFDHLKQILIDGTKAGAEAPVEKAGTENYTPEEAVQYYINEAKTLVLYRQFDKAYGFINKVLALKPDHREATRLKGEVKSRFRKDYLIGALLGVLLACALSYLITLRKDVNLLFLCILPVAAGLILPSMANGLFSGRINRPVLRYLTAGFFVVVLAFSANVLLANGLVELERTVLGTRPPVVYRETPVAQSTGSGNSAGRNQVSPSGEENTLDEAGADNEPGDEPVRSADRNTARPAIPAPDTESIVEVDKEAAIRDILKQYYRDYNSDERRFDASKYFAQKVDRFINLKNTTPAEITDVIENEFYDEFQESAISIEPNTLVISKLPKGYYQADFEETMSCFRKSKEQHQFIRTKVKVIFDKDLKIRYNHQERLLESRYALKAAASMDRSETDGPVMYTNQ
jgi:uncharacterized membrane protein